MNIRYMLHVTLLAAASFPTSSFAVVDRDAFGGPYEGNGGGSALDVILGLFVILVLCVVYFSIKELIAKFEDRIKTKNRIKSVNRFIETKGTSVTSDNLKLQSKWALQNKDPDTALSIAAYFGNIKAQRDKLIFSKYPGGSTADKFDQMTSSEREFYENFRDVAKYFAHWLQISSVMCYERNIFIGYNSDFEKIKNLAQLQSWQYFPKSIHITLTFLELNKRFPEKVNALDWHHINEFGLPKKVPQTLYKDFLGILERDPMTAFDCYYASVIRIYIWNDGSEILIDYEKKLNDTLSSVHITSPFRNAFLEISTYLERSKAEYKGQKRR